jgi:hypothetical protein
MKKLILGLNLAIGVAFAASAANAYTGELYRVCGLDPNGDNYLSFRTCGNSSCEEIARLGPGTYMWSMEPQSENGWREVVPMFGVADMFNANPDVGYVYDRYICDAE